MIDTHCHLNDERLYSRRAEVVENALQAGVKKILCVGWDLESSKMAVSIADEFESVYAAVGFHPENLNDISDEALLEIESLTKNKKVIAIGEIGLDYHWFKEQKDRDNQKLWFVKQIELANKLQLPVSVHARDATQDTFDILKDHPVDKGCVLHCYSGSPEMMKRFEGMNVFFGFDGPITFKNAENPIKCVLQCKMDRILIETDSPYMAPVPFRGKDNEPAYVRKVLEKIAEIKGTSTDEMERITEENSLRLYGF